MPLVDVARAIARYAFVASPYPLIISAEIHCSLKQQDMAAEIMLREFGDALVTSTLDGEDVIEQLPSPERLKGRILLKACFLLAFSSFVRLCLIRITLDRRRTFTPLKTGI